MLRRDFHQGCFCISDHQLVPSPGLHNLDRLRPSYRGIKTRGKQATAFWETEGVIGPGFAQAQTPRSQRGGKIGTHYEIPVLQPGRCPAPPGWFVRNKRERLRSRTLVFVY